MTRGFRNTALAALMLSGLAGAALAANPMVGGAPMYASKNIVENAVNSKDHTTLVAAVKAAGLVETLEGTGPFTVFAPNNKAFAALPEGTVDTLLLPENKGKLTDVLTYHVVAGKLTTADLAREIAANGGVYRFKTVNGAELAAQERGGVIYIGDMQGHNATITIPDVMQSNGVIQGINMVLMPM